MHTMVLYARNSQLARRKQERCIDAPAHQVWVSEWFKTRCRRVNGKDRFRCIDVWYARLRFWGPSPADRVS